MPEVPVQLIRKKSHQLVQLLKEKLKDSCKYYQFENDDDDFNSIMVCNNACWTLGELSAKAPESLKPYLQEIMGILAEILNTDIIT